MKESSWREQEALDRRLAELGGERSQLAAKLEAAQAEVEAARREAAVQRRLAKRLQQRPAAADEGEASKQMVRCLWGQACSLSGCCSGVAGTSWRESCCIVSGPWRRLPGPAWAVC